MSQSEPSGQDVALVICIGGIVAIGVSSFLNSYDDRKIALTDKEKTITEVKTELLRCQYEFAGYQRAKQR